MIRRSFELPAPDGRSIPGEVRIPEGPPPRAAVVLVHGFKGFRSWGFFPHVADSLAAGGHAVVTFDFSLNGLGGGDGARFLDLEGFARNTFSREVFETRTVIEALMDGELVPRRPDRLGLLGHSRGGGIALVAASESGRVASLVTWAGLCRFDRWQDETVLEWRERGRVHVMNARTGQQMPLDLSLFEDWESNRERLDLIARARSWTRPWLIVHGTADATVRDQDAHILAEAGPTAKLVLVEGAGHTFGATHPFEGTTPHLDEALRRSRGFFHETLAR